MKNQGENNKTCSSVLALQLSLHFHVYFSCSLLSLWRCGGVSAQDNQPSSIHPPPLIGGSCRHKSSRCARLFSISFHQTLFCFVSFSPSFVSSHFFIRPRTNRKDVVKRVESFFSNSIDNIANAFSLLWC